MDKNNICSIYRLIWKCRIKENKKQYHNRFRYDDKCNHLIKYNFYDDDKPQCLYALNFRYNNYPWHKGYICSFTYSCCVKHDTLRNIKSPHEEGVYLSKNYINLLTFEFI